MNYLALFEEDDTMQNVPQVTLQPNECNAPQADCNTYLNEAMARVASLYPSGLIETFTPEQEHRMVKIQSDLDEALFDVHTDHHAAIDEWEREWLILLGFHPVPQDALSRMQSWDHQKVWDTLLRGIPVKIWSVVLGEWIFWVRDTKVAEKTATKYPGIPIYTLQELKIMTQTKWTREYLQKMHLNKSVLGATLVESSRVDS